jgi:DNA ligase D-like protein (predicted 3'-phosphoesterase)
MTDKLGKYRSKRNFQTTTEPVGIGQKIKNEKPIFVIQKHAAQNLHYDFRLEIDGVLVSWTIPKGPSLDPGQKQLAIPTEDHPIEYADFEGKIPKDQYGGGSVIIWDYGHYHPIDKTPEEMLQNHKIEIRLYGKKLRGGFTLIKMKGRDQWLLIKTKDEEADSETDILKSRPESAVSGQVIEEI